MGDDLHGGILLIEHKDIVFGMNKEFVANWHTIPVCNTAKSVEDASSLIISYIETDFGETIVTPQLVYE